MAEHRNWTPEEVLNLTLPQLWAVYCGGKEEESQELRGDAHLMQILEQQRSRQQRIIDLMETGQL